MTSRNTRQTPPVGKPKGTIVGGTRFRSVDITATESSKGKFQAIEIEGETTPATDTTDETEIEFLAGIGFAGRRRTKPPVTTRPAGTIPGGSSLRRVKIQLASTVNMLFQNGAINVEAMAMPGMKLARRQSPTTTKPKSGNVSGGNR